MCATANGYANIVKLLLEAGANTEAHDEVRSLI